jgi:hypothetical protein
MMRAHADPDVPEGTCVLSLYGVILYAGPIGRCRVTAPGAVILLNPADFASLVEVLDEDETRH